MTTSYLWQLALRRSDI